MSQQESKHPNDMNAEELRELVVDMGWAALDLAQHLSFTDEMLKEEYRENAYKRAGEMAYAISNMPYSRNQRQDNTNQIIILGENGLERF